MDARIELYKVQKMLKRAAKSDVQMEEYANFVSLSDELDFELRECLKKVKSKQNGAISDTAANTFFKMRNANRNSLLSGSRKQDAVNRRKNVDATLQKMYYDYKFE